MENTQAKRVHKVHAYMRKHKTNAVTACRKLKIIPTNYYAAKSQLKPKKQKSPTRAKRTPRMINLDVAPVTASGKLMVLVGSKTDIVATLRELDYA